MMVGINQGRIKRREIRSPFVELAFEGTKRGINAEAAEENNDGEKL